MVQTNKILTVSYGTFSCTLEGFDESFETMKAIAEYFRDLAADDRYFGAEPPTPDAEMLARIAEKEISRRVEARFEDDGIVLRPSLAAAAAPETAPEAAPETAPETAPEPAETEAEAETQAETQAETAADTPTEVTEAAEADAPVLALTDEAEHATAEDDTPGSAPSEDASAEDETVAKEATEEPATDVTPEVAMAPAKPATSSVPESIAEKLARIRAVVSSAASSVTRGDTAARTDTPDSAPEAQDDSTTANIMSTLASGDGSDTLAETDEPFSLDAEYAVTDESDDVDLAAEAELYDVRPTEDDGEEARAAEEAAEQARAEEEARAAEEAAEQARAEEEARAAEEAAEQARAEEEARAAEEAAEQARAEEEARAAEEAAEQARAEEEARAAEEAAEQARAEEEARAAEEAAEQARAEEEARAAEEAAEQARAEEEARAAEEAAEQARAEEEARAAEEAAEQARAEEEARAAEEAAAQARPDEDTDADAEPPRVAPRRPVRVVKVKRRPAAVPAPVETSLTPEDEDDLARELAEVEAEFGADQPSEETREAIADAVEDTTRAVRAMARRERRDNFAEDEGDVSRLLAETDEQLQEPEGRSRRNAIAHLRAAVAATRADRSGDDKPARDTDPSDAYKSDLAQAVRPRRSTVSEPTTERPRVAPLKLVAEQRVDLPQDERPEAVSVRPRRVAMPVDRDEDEDAGGFASFAEEAGASRLPDLLEAAAAYMSFVEGRDEFSRPQLMTKVRQVERGDSSREDRLRSFGQLLRDGKIQKVQGGRFTASETIGYRPGDRAAG